MRSTLRGGLLVSVLAMASLMAAACSHDGDGVGGNKDGGSDGGSNPIAGLKSITVAPAMVTLTLSGATAVTQAYTAQGTFADGKTSDITGKVAWSVGDITLGSFNGATFTSVTDHGGSSAILATAGSIVGQATINIVLQQNYPDPGSANLPADPESAFGGAASTTDNVVPRLVYPNDNVLLPPNLGQLEFHFTPGGDGSATSPNTLFELSFENAITDVKLYLRCPTAPAYTDAASTPAVLSVKYGCIYTTDPTLWNWIATTNRGGDPVTVTVRGTTDTGGAVGSSSSVHISFSYDDIQGALYYWEIGNDSPCVDAKGNGGPTGPGCGGNDTTAIVRFDFAGTDPAGTTFITPNTTGATGGTCVGCHALSRDGTALVAEAGGQGDGRALLWNVATSMPTVPFGQADRTFFESWSADGTQYVGVNNFSDDPSQDGTAGGNSCTGNGANCDLNVRIYDGLTGKFVADVPGTSLNDLPADHPDWSPDGNSIAYTLVGKQGGNYPNTLQQGYAGSIYFVTRSGAGWSTPTAVVTSPDDHTSFYYPAYSPDNSFLVFDRAQCAAGGAADSNCWFDTAPTSRLFAALPQPSAAPVELVNANKPGPLDASANITNSYPKWSPFVFQRTGEFGSKLMWLTFASKRSFGLRAQPYVNSRGADGEILWMSGVDPQQIGGGADGSFVPFAIPFQRLFKSNHIAQWATKLVPPVS